MKEQELLFSIESVLDIHPLENFKILFDNLNADHLDSAYMRISVIKSITALSPSKNTSICELALNGSSQDC